MELWSRFEFCEALRFEVTVGHESADFNESCESDANLLTRDYSQFVKYARVYVVYIK